MVSTVAPTMPAKSRLANHFETACMCSSNYLPRLPNGLNVLGAGVGAGAGAGLITA